MSNKENTPKSQKQMAEMPLEELRSYLNASPDGLSQAEAQRRLTDIGYNELPEKKTNLIIKFLSYFWGPIPWMIEIAMILSALDHEWDDFYVILVLLIMNVIVGFWEEFKAGNVVAALKQKLALQAKVKRDGTWKTIPARELVPGDLVRLRIGDKVPADARLLESDPVEVDQSVLTGESLPVTRKLGDTCYSGSTIKRGETDALAYATGKNTFFGKTTQLVEEAYTVSHLQRAIIKISDYLIVIAVVLVILILSVAFFRGERMTTTIAFALVLVVASIPVALPTVLSITMAVGARTLARKEAVVTRLSSIEELAGIDVLCSDKTGTLTQNKLTLGKPFCVNGVKPDFVILCAALASRAEDQDTIDLTILSGLKNKEQMKTYQIIHFDPFDPVKKRTEAKVKEPGGRVFAVTKGAPQVILSLVDNADKIKPQVENAVEEFAKRGFRSLSVARADEQGKWQFLGVIPLYDPPREDSKATIDTAGKMGIKVKMLTGDQVVIAKEIAQELNIGTNILNANLFTESKPHEVGQINDAIEQVDGFAQVFPEHKYHIVDVLQQRNHIVGMTGDGVNDAPALKKADVGVAVSDATDAARAAADIVLLNPGLSVIIDAIKESRKIFQRMNNYTIYRISETIRVLLFMTLSILIFNFYPITAIMIVLIAVLNDGAVISLAYDRSLYSDKPEVWNMTIVLGLATVLGIIGLTSSFGLFYIAERILHIDREAIQSLMYLKLSVAGQMTIYNTRTRGPFWSVRPALIFLLATISAQLLSTFFTVYGLFMPPISLHWAGLVWGYAFAWFLVTDGVKLLAYRIFDHRQPGLLLKKTG